MNFFEEAEADAREMLAEVGRPVVFRDREFRAMLPTQEMGLDLQTGGFAENGQLTVRLLAADFGASPPADGERIAHAGKTYRIVSVSRRIPSAWVEVRCNPLSQ